MASALAFSWAAADTGANEKGGTLGADVGAVDDGAVEAGGWLAFATRFGGEPLSQLTSATMSNEWVKRMPIHTSRWLSNTRQPVLRTRHQRR